MASSLLHWNLKCHFSSTDFYLFVWTFSRLTLRLLKEKPCEWRNEMEVEIQNLFYPHGYISHNFWSSQPLISFTAISFTCQVCSWHLWQGTFCFLSPSVRIPHILGYLERAEAALQQGWQLDPEHWVEVCEMLTAMETAQIPAQTWILSTSNHTLCVWSIGLLRLAVLFRTTAHTWNIILFFTLLVWLKFLLLTKPFHPKLKPRLVQPSEALIRCGCGNPQDQWVWILKHICVYVEEIWESIFWLMVSP